MYDCTDALPGTAAAEAAARARARRAGNDPHATPRASRLNLPSQASQAPTARELGSPGRPAFAALPAAGQASQQGAATAGARQGGWGGEEARGQDQQHQAGGAGGQGPVPAGDGPAHGTPEHASVFTNTPLAGGGASAATAYAPSATGAGAVGEEDAEGDLVMQDAPDNDRQ
ncbi:hypothetical protein HRG_003484 [Hirsutella rhossiliensis]|uniref:Uncharacterized protein n=1 Tax=Hirsutella rhossiliensis TaxID=111463 RepID=A0A9P8MZR7_9HYPO|nr:uncharacterized protein HRG_03484 [Hirsutella rhossiliensis]KAH0965468.1 hypothetical protein HRG_03484 [Hirsutella rhossiliensis]